MVQRSNAIWAFGDNSYKLPVRLCSHLMSMSMDALWILTVWFHWRSSLLQAPNSGRKTHKHAWTRYTLLQSIMFTKTPSNGHSIISSILCNTLLVQNCGDNRHIFAPGVYVAIKLTQLFIQCKRLRKTLCLLTILIGTQKVIDKGENYCYWMLNSNQEFNRPPPKRWKVSRWHNGSPWRSGKLLMWLARTPLLPHILLVPPGKQGQ